jgi:hypothetical protein
MLDRFGKRINASNRSEMQVLAFLATGCPITGVYITMSFGEVLVCITITYITALRS